MHLWNDRSAKHRKMETSMSVRCEYEDEYYLEHIRENMASPQRQWHPSSPHESTGPGLVSCRGLIFGIHGDANRDEPGNTTSVLDTNVEESMRHFAGVLIQSENGLSCRCESCGARCHQATVYRC